MDLILYITGGIALLGFAWLFISLARTISGALALLTEVRGDVHSIVLSVDDVKSKLLPILGNVTNITSNVVSITGNVSSITEGIRDQMLGVHETVDDALDIFRGTLEDIERLKNEVVATVEGPVHLVRQTTGGVVGTAIKVVGLISKLVNAKKKSASRNGQAERD